MLTPIVNNNGDTWHTIKTDLCAATDALQVAQTALSKLHASVYHGRNWQLNEPGEYLEARAELDKYSEAVYDAHQHFTKLLIETHRTTER